MSSQRLVPRWYAAMVTLVLAAASAGFLVLGATSTGPLAATGLLSGIAFLLLLVAALRALVLPRRRRQLPVRADGVAVIVAPGTIVWPLLTAWFLFFAIAALWCFVAVSDFDAIESPGFVLLLVLGVLASTRDLVRLLTGRLHRWRLTMRHDDLTYRGYRTDVTVPWSKVRGARIQARGPAGVLVDLKGTGPDLVLPITAFDVPAEQIVEAVESAMRASTT